MRFRQIADGPAATREQLDQLRADFARSQAEQHRSIDEELKKIKREVSAASISVVNSLDALEMRLRTQILQMKTSLPNGSAPAQPLMHSGHRLIRGGGRSALWANDRMTGSLLQLRALAKMCASASRASHSQLKDPLEA